MSSVGNGRPAASRRREVLGGVAAALVVLAVVVAGLLLRGSGDGGGGGGGGDVAAAGTAAAAPAPPVAPSAGPPPPAAQPAPGPAPGTTGPAALPADVDELPPSLPPVGLDDAAPAGDGVTGSLTSIEAVQGAGRGAGNIAGPALRVTVRLVNGTADPVALDGVAVDLTTGAGSTPAPPVDDPSSAPFTGTLEPGGTAEGVYVFTVPEDARDRVTVSVGYVPGAPYMVFAGSAG